MGGQASSYAIAELPQTHTRTAIVSHATAQQLLHTHWTGRTGTLSGGAAAAPPASPPAPLQAGRQAGGRGPAGTHRHQCPDSPSRAINRPTRRPRTHPRSARCRVPGPPPSRGRGRRGWWTPARPRRALREGDRVGRRAGKRKHVSSIGCLDWRTKNRRSAITSSAQQRSAHRSCARWTRCGRGRRAGTPRCCPAAVAVAEGEGWGWVGGGGDGESNGLETCWHVPTPTFPPPAAPSQQP